MKQLTDALDQSIKQENWYAALTLALTLPDICGKLEHPGKGSQARYVGWWEEYVQIRYTSGSTVFLSGRDCYALRCAVLHEGSDDIVTQRAREALDAFLITEPLGGGYIHNNLSDGKLQLQVDILCSDLMKGALAWDQTMASQPDVKGRIDSLMKVRGWAEPLPH